MKKVGIIAKLSNPRAVEVSGEVAKWLTERKVEVYGDKGLAESVKLVKVVSKEDMPEVIDTLIVLGGDGTMLAAARVIGGRKIPRELGVPDERYRGRGLQGAREDVEGRAHTHRGENDALCGGHQGWAEGGLLQSPERRCNKGYHREARGA
jgi:hypothetical protein